MATADTDGDGFLDEEEFVRLVEETAAGTHEEEGDRCREAFGMYEMEGKGCITPLSLKLMMSRLGLHLDADDRVRGHDTQVRSEQRWRAHLRRVQDHDDDELIRLEVMRLDRLSYQSYASVFIGQAQKQCESIPSFVYLPFFVYSSAPL
jgi:hypothetical protein